MFDTIVPMLWIVACLTRIDGEPDPRRSIFVSLVARCTSESRLHSLLALSLFLALHRVACEHFIRWNFMMQLPRRLPFRFASCELQAAQYDQRDAVHRPSTMQPTPSRAPP